jgi:hypothetical protein
MPQSLYDCFAPEEIAPVPVESEVGWASEPLWTLRSKGKYLDPIGIRNPIIHLVARRYTDWSTQAEAVAVNKLWKQTEWRKQNTIKVLWILMDCVFNFADNWSLTFWYKARADPCETCLPVCLCVSWLGKLFRLLAYHSEPLLSWSSDQVQRLFRQQMPREKDVGWRCNPGIRLLGLTGATLNLRVTTSRVLFMD